MKARWKRRARFMISCLQVTKFDVDRAAQDHFARVQIYSLQIRPLDSLQHYPKAYQYRPERIAYAMEYAVIL